MSQAVIVKIIIASAFSLDVVFSGEKYQFFLDIYDMMDSSWIQTKYNVIDTTVQCASLCYRHKNHCAYFGYKGSTCYLLKNTVDRNFCSQDNCTDSGMRVYKRSVEDLSTTTTTEADDPISTLPGTTTKNLETTSTLTITDNPITTTSEVPITSRKTTKTEVSSTPRTTRTSIISTAEPSITTLKTSSISTTILSSTAETKESDTTITTSKTDINTTTTGTDTTTTTEMGTTTTTEVRAITTITEAGTTTTDSVTTTAKDDTTTRSTKAGTTTTTDKDVITTTTDADTTTSTTMSSTSTTTGGPTTTTQGAWSCPEPPDGAEVEVECASNEYLLRQMGSRSPFFGDVLAAACTPMNEQVYVDEVESYTFFSPDGGFTLISVCPHKHHVIVKFKLCVVAGHIPAVTLDCHRLKDPDRIEEHYNKSTLDESGIHQLVNCGDYGGIQAIYLSEGGDDNRKFTRVDFSCIRIQVDSSIPDAAPDTGAGP